MKGKLYIVGTPIGNLEDITLRALNTLKDVDLIAAEDTRVTLKLLNHYNIKKPLISYREQIKNNAHPKILNLLNEGKSIAFVSDAGMPVISDPGFELISFLNENNIETSVIPGPSALTSAICLSSINCENFLFLGFLKRDENEKILKLSSLKSLPFPLVIYESPKRLIKTLSQIEQVMGNRKISIAKELTKSHETITTTTITDALFNLKDNPPKGEYVLIVDKDNNYTNSLDDIKEAIVLAKEMISLGIRATEAAKTVASLSKFSKSEIYKSLIKEGIGKTKNE